MLRHSGLTLYGSELIIKSQTKPNQKNYES